MRSWDSCRYSEVTNEYHGLGAKGAVDEDRRTADMLIKTGICRKDGSIEEYVAKYLNALAMKELGVKGNKYNK